VKYSTVIFDLFGTLVDNFSYQDHELVLTEMAEVLDAPSEPFVKHWVDSFNERATGIFPNPEANIEYVLGRIGIGLEPARIEQAARIRLSFSRQAMVPRHDAVPTLVQLRKTGFKIGLISDCSTEVPHLWEDSPFAALIDVPVFSCSVGLKKPDPRIYILACERLGVKPSECLYIGDGSSQELSGAHQVGMHPVLIRIEGEEDSDPYRIDAEEWEGVRVSSLAQIISMVGK